MGVWAGPKTRGILPEEEEESSLMTLPKALAFLMALPSYHGNKKLQPIVVVASRKWLFKIRLRKGTHTLPLPDDGAALS
jgi:hypothetical protein